MKSLVWLILITMFIQGFSLRAEADSIVVSRRGENIRANVPTDKNGNSPSVIVNGQKGGFFLATGRAATIIANSQSQATETSNDTLDVEVHQVPLFNAQGVFLGAFTQLEQGIFIGSAHVLSLATEAELLALFNSLNINSELVTVYQPKFKNQFLDVVLISALDPQSVQNALMQILSPDLKSGARYLVEHFSQFDDQLSDQKSTGVVATSANKSRVYLSSETNSFLTKGSSGAAAFVNVKGAPRIIGIVQCVVQNSETSSFGSQNQSYFRAVSARAILSSKLTVTNLELLRSRWSDYDLVKCVEVSGGKEGGGG